MVRKSPLWGPFWRAMLLGGVILVVEFAVLEAAMRAYGGSEASSPFQALFMQDPRVGHRPRPGASATYTTSEFSTHLTINAQGVRDTADIGPKAPGERRVLILGDSLVFSVQVPFEETFGERLEARLNESSDGPTWRVINAGVQGYGPVESWLFFDHVAAALEADIVLPVVFVGNDAVEAFGARAKLEAGGVPEMAPIETLGYRLRLFVRRSQVLQIARLRVEQLRTRLETSVPERPLVTYLADAPPEVFEGLETARVAFGRIADRAAGTGAATAFVLMPARFQTDDADYTRLAAIVADAGGALERQLATERFRETLAPLGRPTLDLLPVLWAEQNRSELFFQRNVHLTRRGHDVVARALFDFLEARRLTRAGPD